MVMILMVYFSGFKVVFTAMPAAFAALDVPPVYAMLFFLSMFLSGIMFLVRNMSLPNISSVISGLTKPGEVGDFFALVSMKSPNFCQKAKF